MKHVSAQANGVRRLRVHRHWLLDGRASGHLGSIALRTVHLYHPLATGEREYSVQHVFEGLRIVTFFTRKVPLPPADQFDSETGEDWQSPSWTPF